MSYKKIIAIARAKDTEQNIDAIIDYLSFKLLLVLGPNGKLKSDKDEALFFFDTFDGVSMKAKIINDKLIEKNYILSNLNDEKKEKIIHEFFKLEGSFFKISKSFLNQEVPREDYSLIIEDLVSICGGGLIKTINYEDEIEVKIIGGKLPKTEEKEKAIALTEKMLKSNLFSEEEKEIVLSKKNDEIPVGYFIGLLNGFLTNRYIVSNRITEEELSILLPAYNEININFIKKNTSIYSRILLMHERLNTLSFVQYLIQIKKLQLTTSRLLALYEENIKEYSSFVESEHYDIQKNTKGIKDLILFMENKKEI